MRDEADRWLRSATSVAADWPTALLVEAKADTTVSVVLPALNEGETVGPIVEAIREHLMGASGLVDELLVLDSGSTDDTAQVAEQAGARVLHRDDVMPAIEAATGKGEAMWRAVAATHGDIVVFVDADLRSFTPEYVTGLIGPLLCQPDVLLVKAFYERPYVGDDAVVRAGGGRVTELVARPLLNLLWPELAGVIQPLAGEYAARRSLLEQLPFPCGYGVELALLIETFERHGLGSLAQVDLGVRVHRHQDEQALGRMAAQIMRTALVRPTGSPAVAAPPGITLAQFERGPDGFVAHTHAISDQVRPPLASVPEYASLRSLRA